MGVMGREGTLPSVTLSEFSSQDAHWMQVALSLAQDAARAGEVPVGAVVVKDGTMIASGHNRTITWCDPTAHAEVVALREAAKHLGNHRLSECHLYVTLEPCLMCCGAMLHARLKRVVFAAKEDKTGAAGSVLNVFSHEGLNHQTLVQHGLLATESADLLQAFFRTRRANPNPLREDALRTPETCFKELDPTPWESSYISDLLSLAGLRLHYLDVRDPPAAHSLGASVTWLALHPPEDWSHRFHAVIPQLLADGHRVLAPDLIGFGRSDKLKKEKQHTRAWHLQVLTEWLAHVDAQHCVLLLPQDGHGLGMQLQLALPHRFLHAAQAPMAPTVPADHAMAQSAPYPDTGYRAGPRAFGLRR